MSKSLVLSFLFFLILWAYRLNHINGIIQHGQLADFQRYYDAAATIVGGQSNSKLIADATFGPPSTIIPYLPFALLPFMLAEYALTVLNVFCYFIVFYRIWKRFLGKISWFFWFFLSLLAFSFPIIFSLGMGNPIGIVTLGIYSFFIIRNKFIKTLSFTIAILLKLFPVILLFHFVFSKEKIWKILLVLFLCTSATVIIALPSNSWTLYSQSFQKIYATASADPAIYNQSFTSTLARMGVSSSPFSPLYLGFALSILTLVISRAFVTLSSRGENNTELRIAAMLFSAALLLHPFPWQYYFATLLPFVMIRLKQKTLVYLFIFLLLSLNGGNFSIESPLKALLDSTQFVGTLLLFMTVCFERNHNFPRTRNE